MRFAGFAAGLATVILSCDVPPAAMNDGVNDLAIVGGPSTVALVAELAELKVVADRVWPL